MPTTTKDTLGDRQKSYENQYAAQRLLPLIPICARMDGRAFHSFTRGLARPFDPQFSALMIETTRYLVAETGATVGYTQSDEISLTWFADSPSVMPFFNAKVLKMASVLAALTTAKFNLDLPKYLPEKVNSGSSNPPIFDARVWNVPTLDEAALYLLWREQDATRNSVSMAAQSCYNHKQLHQVSSSGKMDLLMAKGINWNDYPASFKRGTYVRRVEVERAFTSNEIDRLPAKHEARRNPSLTIRRHDVQVVAMPPLGRVTNRIGSLFLGEVPELRRVAGPNELAILETTT